MKFRFLASHLFLLKALSDFTGSEVNLSGETFQTFDKPRLSDGRISFSLSRSDPFAAVGISTTHELGIDIEVPRALSDASALAKRVLSKVEYSEWQSFPDAEQAERFFMYWRMKEAILKATGDGLSQDPRLIHLTWQGTELRLGTLPDAYPPLPDWQAGECRLTDDDPDIAWAAFKRPA